MRQALLVLEDGAVFEGEGFGAELEGVGEVVFNTGMTGYQEVLSDPSYEGQIVAMTYPHIGNYGVNDQDPESTKLWVRGFVTRELPEVWSSWRGSESLDENLRHHGIPAISEVDTRRLTRHLREKGAMRAVISGSGSDVDSLVRKARQSPSMVGANLVDRVSCPEPYRWPADGPGRFSVAALDFGIKLNSLRELAARGCEVTVFPSSTPADEILRLGPDGLFISNGPGDPEAVGHGIRQIRSLLGKLPMFGICLGHQLMGLAAGMETYKLRFGHHGSNHPVARLADGSIQITTQNHGFALAESAFGFQAPERPGSELSAPAPVSTPFGRARLSHVNLNDGTVEGFRLDEAGAFSVQFHPEGGPGPHDSRYLFDEFCSSMDGDRAQGRADAAAH